jgi:hypothetical protein
MAIRKRMSLSITIKIVRLGPEIAKRTGLNSDNSLKVNDGPKGNFAKPVSLPPRVSSPRCSTLWKDLAKRRWETWG